MFHADGAADSTEYTHELLCSMKYDSVPRLAHPVAAALFEFNHHVQQASQLQHELLEFAAACQPDCMDGFAPTPSALLSGHNDGFADAWDSPPLDAQPWAVWHQHRLEQVAGAWVAGATPFLAQQSHPPARSGQHVGESDARGVSGLLGLDSVAASFFPAARARPIVLLEPFGGLCAGLEMALRNGNGIQQYFYLDTDPTARRVAVYRISQLMAYPSSTPPCCLCCAEHLLFATGHQASHH